MLDDANRQAETDRPLRADKLEPYGTGADRPRTIECGPTDEDRSERPPRSGRGRREKEGEPSGRFRRHEH